MALEWRLSLTVTCDDCKATATFAREYGAYDPIDIEAVERDAFGGQKTGWAMIHGSEYCSRCKWSHVTRPHAAPAMREALRNQHPDDVVDALGVSGQDPDDYADALAGEADPACPNFPGACECLPEELIWKR